MESCILLHPRILLFGWKYQAWLGRAMALTSLLPSLGRRLEEFRIPFARFMDRTLAQLWSAGARPAMRMFVRLLVCGNDGGFGRSQVC